MRCAVDICNAGHADGWPFRDHVHKWQSEKHCILACLAGWIQAFTFAMRKSHSAGVKKPLKREARGRQLMCSTDPCHSALCRKQ